VYGDDGRKKSVLVVNYTKNTHFAWNIKSVWKCAKSCSSSL